MRWVVLLKTLFDVEQRTNQLLGHIARDYFLYYSFFSGNRINEKLTFCFLHFTSFRSRSEFKSIIEFIFRNFWILFGLPTSALGCLETFLVVFFIVWHFNFINFNLIILGVGVEFKSIIEYINFRNLSYSPIMICRMFIDINGFSVAWRLTFSSGRNYTGTWWSATPQGGLYH